MYEFRLPDGTERRPENHAHYYFKFYRRHTVESYESAKVAEIYNIEFARGWSVWHFDRPLLLKERLKAKTRNEGLVVDTIDAAVQVCHRHLAQHQAKRTIAKGHADRYRAQAQQQLAI